MCGPACITGVPLHSLSSPKQSTNRVAYVQGKSSVTLLAGRGLGAWRKTILELSRIEQGRAASGQLLKLDQGKVCLRLYNPPPPISGNKS